jgi:hypothetical protein
MKQICKKCLLVGHGRHGLFSGNIYVAIAQISLGLALIAINIDRLSGPELIIHILAALSIVVGVFNLLDSRKPGRICPRCNKSAMVVMESEEGQRFIKENNISLPQ